MFDQEALSCDAGLLAVHEHEKRSGLLDKLAGAISEKRESPRHTLGGLLKQRVYQIISGNPDANDSDRQRHDPTLQLISTGKDAELASQPTMTRLENSVTLKELIRLSYVIGDAFLDSFKKAPRLIIIDMDPTAHLVYGQQQLGLFNTHIGDTCLMPFHVYDGITGRVITTVIREGRTPGAPEILRLLKRIVSRIRKRYPKTRLLFRADSHHTKPEVMDYLNAGRIDFISGLGPNSVLEKVFAGVIEKARKTHELEKQNDPFSQRERHVHASAQYQAQSWSRPQRVVCRIIFGPNGFDVRYVVTSYEHLGAKFLYTVVYCGRGNAERHIKEHKLGLQSDRSPCYSALANQFRLLLHSAAYTLLHGFRESVLAGTELAAGSFEQIRIKLLKVCARVERMKTRIRFHLPVNFGYKQILARLARGQTGEVETQAGAG